jgi:hypothetical protein
MSSQDPTKTRASKGAVPLWDEKWMRTRTRRLWFVGVGVIVGIWIFLLVWVLFLAQIQDTVARPLEAGADLALVLAPVLAAALGVERVLETLFNMIESAWRTLVAYLGFGMRWLKSAQTEVAEARQWVQSMGTVYNGTLAVYNEQMKTMLENMNVSPNVASLPDQLSDAVNKLRAEAEEKADAAKLLLEDAQRRLQEAENKLASVTGSPDYRSAKGAATIVLGLMMGVIVAAVGQIQAFALLGIGAVPPQFDVLITGLVIGSGSYPVHSLVGILQQSKDALDGLGTFLNNRAAPSVQAVEQKITTIQPAGPGQPPVVGQAVIQTTAAQSPEPAAGG